MIKINDEAIILIHGLGRTHLSMRKANNYFSDLGYKAISLKYPSRKDSISALSKQYLLPTVTKLKMFKKMHFLTHSMGGIIVRQFLQNFQLPEGSRIVMLSPPNKGSEIIDFYKRHPALNMVMSNILGPAGMSLSTGLDSTITNLKRINNYEIGVITGNKSLEFWYWPLFKDPNDGKVSVKSAKLNEMKDFLVVNKCHTWIMNNLTVLQQAQNFFKSGYFLKGDRNEV